VILFGREREAVTYSRKATDLEQLKDLRQGSMMINVSVPFGGAKACKKRETLELPGEILGEVRGPVRWSRSERIEGRTKEARNSPSFGKTRSP